MYKSLTAAEKVVMKAMWDSDHPLSLGETTKLLNESYGKNWKPQTVSTFIAKVVQKGFLKMVREGRRITYEILISLARTGEMWQSFSPPISMEGRPTRRRLTG